jgi:peroxiredoxin
MTPSYSALRHLGPVFVFLVATAPTRADTAATSVPRYRLAVGQVLTYRGTDEFRTKTRSIRWATECKIWVVRANADGSRRLVFRSNRRATIIKNGQTADTGLVEDPVAYCDIFPDGRIEPNESLGAGFELSSLFPRLPKDEEEARRGWQETDDRQAARTEFKASGASNDPNDWVFEGIPQNPFDRINLISYRSRFLFDAKRGLIRRVENEHTERFKVIGEGSGTEELTGVEELGADRLKSLEEESERYLAASRTYRGLLAEANRDAGRADALLARAESTLKAAREGLAIGFLRDQIDKDLKKHSDMASFYVEEARRRAALVGHDAADWETKDLEGKSHSLKQYRGKVVLLDFWYRRCEWCVRAMPQMKSLVEDFEGEPVAVLGMNIDPVEEDARIVATEMRLNYPTLKAEGLPEKYHVQGYPTLIIIDQSGKVADVHDGYTHTLREEVSRSVRKLLPRE